MITQRKLPTRERVYVHSLMYHGYRFVRRRRNLKKKKGYVVPATNREDSSGIDFWVKMPGSMVLIPVQITQRGVKLFRKHDHPTPVRLEEFIQQSERRIDRKRRACIRHKIAFILVRDHDGQHTNKTLAWSDIHALRYAIRRYVN
ncbi:MAG: hypothetical protein JWL75_661 [Parcubacteria group bacterium]|nr:hypothetical protein [Parcubacteria group bacterium]